METKIERPARSQPPQAEAVGAMHDQLVFNLDPKAWDAFMQVLESPPAPNAELRKLMAGKNPWT